MSSVPRRVREQRRDFYARTPDNNARVNTPNGYLQRFPPVAWEAGEVAAGRPGGWWVGSDQPWYAGPGMSAVGVWGADGGFGPIGPAGPGWGPRGSTVGSPLTVPSRHPNGGAAGDGWLLPAVTRCLSIIVESVVATMWVWRDRRGDVLRPPLWVSDPMLLGGSPGPIGPEAPLGRRLTAHGFWSTVLADAILWGQGGFVFAEAEDRSPLPGSLQLLNPFGFRALPSGVVELGTLTDSPFATDFDGRFTMAGVPYRVAVLHGMAPNHDGWPQGVLARHWLTFRIGARLGRYVENFYHSGIPSGYLSVSTPNFGACIPDPDHPGQEINEAELLKRRWMQAHGSGERQVAVLGSTVSYTPISVNPVDGDAAALAALNRADVAHAFGMSAIWLDQGASGLTYQNDSGRRAELVLLTSGGWGQKLVELLSSLMPFGTDCSIVWPTFISPALDVNAGPVTQLVQAGVITAAEARQQIGLTRWDGPDPRFRDVSVAAGGGEQ
jgi:hypothetical protein